LQDFPRVRAALIKGALICLGLVGFTLLAIFAPSVIGAMLCGLLIAAAVRMCITD
jgi:hypothetical protein